MFPNSFSFYFFTFLISLIFSLAITPIVRSLAISLDIFDHPVSSVKTHKHPVPYLGGVAIFLGFLFALIIVRYLTDFPTGTLRSLRGIILGGVIIFTLGLVDDIKHHGLHYRTKFFFQIIAAILVVYYGVQIRFIQPSWFATLITIAWIVGVTNAFNLVDIMDGLASGIAIVCSLAFLLISIPTEEIFVNFTAAALCGSALGFFPYNLSKNFRIFMGDSGSLFLGFILSVLSLGTSYGEKTSVGIFAPLVILALPIFDTLLVFVLRIRRGISPFLGSKDHYALRLEALGWNRRHILIFSLLLSTMLSVCAFGVTRVNLPYALSIYMGILFLLGLFTSYVLKHKIEK